MGLIKYVAVGRLDTDDAKHVIIAEKADAKEDSPKTYQNLFKTIMTKDAAKVC